MRFNVAATPQFLKTGVIAALAVGAFVLRIWDIENRFWMLGDQVRDWGIALGPFSELPLVGPATHVHGYTIGPAFYWILWLIRVIVGPFFENLPHAGGIGQAALHTAADTLLLVAVWRRTGSPWVASATFVMVVTSALGLSLAGLVWNPTMGSTLATTATALVLLNWHRRSAFRLGVVAAVAWSSVHAYTGAVFVALAVLLTLVVDAWLISGRTAAARALVIVTVVVAALQIPYVVNQLTRPDDGPAMAAVTGGVADILSGRASPLFWQSLIGYRDAVQHLEMTPIGFTTNVSWLLVVGGLLTAWLYRRDPQLLMVVLPPQVAAIAGFAFFLGTLDTYYYLSLMPAAILTVFLPLARIPNRIVGHAAGAAIVLVVLVTVPGRVAYSNTILKLPEYKVLVSASRTIRNAHKPFRAIVTEFPLPDTCDSEFLFRVLGGRTDHRSPWVAVISANGEIRYINNDENARRGRGGS